MHAGSAGVPTVEEYLTAHFAAGQILLLDGSCVPATIANGYATTQKRMTSTMERGAVLGSAEAVCTASAAGAAG